MSANAHTTPHTPDTTALVPLRPTGAPPRTGPQHLLTPPKQAAFARALATHGNVRLACRAVQVSSQTAYRARRASPVFARCWDAALVIARQHAEEVLADRALNGVEEQVFYHGEEVATRRRYDARLLLAHLARLDKRAEVLARCAACDAEMAVEHGFDAAVEALESGEAGEGRAAPPEFASGLCSTCSTLAARTAPADAAPGHAEEEDADDCPPLERRLRAMEAALPPHAQGQSGLSEVDWLRAEEDRLAAFEAGEPQWWLAGSA